MPILVDPHLYNGRPPEHGLRLPQETAVYDLLEQLGVPFESTNHEAAYTIEACAAVEEVLGVSICKNLFLCNRQQTAFYLLLLAGDKPFHTKDLSHQLGVSRLSFAPEEFMQEYLHNTPGSVSVMGLMNDTGNHVQLLIDRSVSEQPLLGCHPCINTSTLRLRFTDLTERFLPAVGHAPIFVDLPEEPPC